MTDQSSWKLASWPELSDVIGDWTAESWDWTFAAVSAASSERGWVERKTARDMLLFTTTLSTATEAVLRLDNADKESVRSIALAVTSVTTAHESNTQKAKTFLTDAFATTAASITSALGSATSSDDAETQWHVPHGCLVLAATKRSVRLTFYSPTGFTQHQAAAKSRAEMAGKEKKKKAPAPWRVTPPAD